MPRLMIAPACLAALSIAASATFAEDLAPDQMGPYQFSAIVNADNVYARSDSSENDYPVAKLSKGDAVTVVGNNGDWLKILPPDGVYCLVGKAWIDARGNGAIGRVRDDATAVNVRIASGLSKSYGKVVTQVKAGADVKIIGQQEEYYQIAPPAGAFAYVHKRFVELVKRVTVVNDHGRLVVNQPGGADKPGDKPADTGGPQLVKVPPIPAGMENPATQPADTGTVAGQPQPGQLAGGTPTTSPSDAPGTQPAVAAADDESFEALEARFNAATKLPLGEQPIDDLIGRYQKVVDAKALPAASMQIAAFRLKGLALRKEAAETLKQGDAERKAREQAQMPLREEAKEISQRMAANESKRYTAVGTLRASSLPSNGKTLYRLTDPATGRTVIYLTDANADAVSREGTFVGVRGPITDDSARQIKLINPQSIESVDPADLAKGTVSSGMVPPSLASTSDAGR